MDKFDKAVESNIDKLSDLEAYVVAEVSPQTRFAGTWGFLRRGDLQFKEKAVRLSEDTKHIAKIGVGNGFIFTVEEKFLMNAVNTLVPGAIPKDFVQKAIERREQDRDAFCKFIKAVMLGGNNKTAATWVQKYSGGMKGVVIGLYCTNETNLISLKGKDYKAFKLTFPEAVQAIYKLEPQLLDRLKVTIKQGLKCAAVPVRSVIGTDEGRQLIYNAMNIAETKTGVFVQFTW